MLRLARRCVVLVLVLLTGVIGVASRVEASDGVRGNRCEVGPDEHIVTDFYFLCRILDVKGSIDGDLIGAATDVTVHPGAVIAGDIWVVGGRLTVAGTVGDDVHFGGLTVLIEPEAAFARERSDLAAVALNTEITARAKLPGDVLVYGYQTIIDGTVGGDIDFRGEALIITGEVNGNVNARVGDSRRSAGVPNLPIYDLSFRRPSLSVDSDAKIGGELLYKAPRLIDIPSSAVEGRIRYEPTGSQRDITKVAEPNDAARILAGYIWDSIRDVVSLMIVGGLMLGVLPSVIRQSAQHVRRRTVPTVGWGLVTFMFTIPMVIVVFLLSLLILLILYLFKLNDLTIIVGAGVLVLTSAAVGGFGFLLFFMGRIVISFVIGQLAFRYVLHMPEAARFVRYLITLALGAAVYALLTNMPVPALGLILELITALAGVGSVVMVMREWVYTSTLFAPSVPLAEPVRAEPTPRAEVPQPGMDNLPEGFTGFDDGW
jgi:cytoskeletal protein CcmA (bactofilin family)